MLSLFISCFLPVCADLRISFPVSNACHCKVHTYFCALAVEVSAKAFLDIFRNVLCNAYEML